MIYKMESTYFTHEELKCKCGCNTADMDSVFMEKLDMLRDRYSKPIVLNSAYRCMEHNDRVGGVADSPHTKGNAVDIKCNGKEAHRLLRVIFLMRFSGVGISQKGKNRFIHIDDKLESPRPNCWTY